MRNEDVKKIVRRVINKYNKLMAECSVINEDVVEFVNRGYYDGTHMPFIDYEKKLNELIKKIKSGSNFDINENFYRLVSTLVNLYSYANLFYIKAGEIVINYGPNGAYVSYSRLVDKERIIECMKKAEEEIEKRKKVLRECKKLLSILKIAVSLKG